MVNGQAGKGSRPRPVDPVSYRASWERIFGGDPDPFKAGSDDQTNTAPSEDPEGQGPTKSSTGGTEA